MAPIVESVEAELGERSAGVWTRADALAVLSPGQVRSRLETRTWQQCWPGVYADGGHVLTLDQRAWAAVLASGGCGQGEPVDPSTREGALRPMRAVAAGRTAARVLGLPLIDDDDPATGAREHLLDDVVVRGAARPVHGGDHDAPRELRRHRFLLREEDLVRTPSGLWVTSVGRTLADCAGLLSHEALVCALDAALHRRLVTQDELQRRAAERHGVEHGPALRAAVELADGRAEAVTETLARLVLLPVLPELEPQVRLVVDGRVLARFDLGARRARLAVETDGKRGHSGERMAAKDHRRDRASRRHGWWTERATWWDCRRGQAALRARVVEEHGRCLAGR